MQLHIVVPIVEKQFAILFNVSDQLLYWLPIAKLYSFLLTYTRYQLQNVKKKLGLIKNICNCLLPTVLSWVSSRVVCSNFLNWPVALQPAVFQCLFGLLVAFVAVLLWSNKLNRRIVPVRIVDDIRVGWSPVGAAQEYQQNPNLAAWCSRFQAAWFFTSSPID